ncbi:MAG: C25 family cysteine peptidase, partial [Parafilimonas sp.]
MRKYCLILISCIVCFNAVAQQYYNEWIDYSKTYYKFKIVNTGLYRINQNTLPAALQLAPAEQFQLWRNGKQIAIYTSVATGVLPANGYIEFYGQKNDGLPDRNLYKDPANQLSTDLSLETDTAAYFLTTNAANNLHITDSVNDVAHNTLPADQSFLYHYRYDFQNMLNRGRAVNLGTNVYSSTYDIGEWWSSNEITPGSALTLNAGNLFAATTSTVTPQLNVAVAGNSAVLGSKAINVAINGSNVISYSNLVGMNAAVLNNNSVNASLINTAATSFVISMTNTNPGGENDRIVTGFIDLSYSRQFNFGGASQFAFQLPATTQGNFLKITGFSGGHAMLYDLTNNVRYADIDGTLQFALPPSASDRNLVLLSEDNAANISTLAQRNFPDYSVVANQGDYLIISNKILTNVPLSGPVADYVDYRKSSAGGAYNVKVCDIDDLVDEFAYGIKQHPLSVKNFLRYARNTFAAPPQFAFLIGKAVTYDQYRLNQSSPYAEKLNLVPTFGWPASDNLLSSNDLTPLPATPIGRLSAVTQSEVATYLAKLEEYEKAQADNTETIANKAWMKTIVHVTGADDPVLNASLTSDLNSYKNIVQDTLFGGNVYSFNKTTSSSGTTILDALMQQLFTNGISLLNYFGHSSASILDYNLNKPDDYNNPGKYPVFIVNGCDAGDIFSFDTARFTTFNSLSEAWVLAPGRGSIAYIASTHFGVESYLNDYNTGFYNSFSRTKYGAPVSYNLKDAVSFLLNNNPGDFIANLHAEESVLHGDPALKINAHALPDFDIEEQNVNIDPTFVSVADNSFKIKCYFYNLGKATGDSVSVLIQRKYPDGSVTTLFSQNIKSVRYVDSVELTVPINATRDKGQNSLTVTIDNLQQYTELSELNNTVTKQFFIYEDELTPIYPYNFSIVNKTSIKLYASTANAVVPLRAYTMEMDTTELFNSQLKSTQTINSVGGALEFNSTIPFTDSTVYYWRVAPVPASGSYLWNTSSFVYLPTTGFGYNQSHLYQHLKSVGDRIYIDSFSRKWTYTNITSTLGMYNAVFGSQYNTPSYFQVAINNSTVSSSSCLGSSIIFNLFDPVTLQPYYNQPVPSTVGSGGNYGGFMNSYKGSCIQKGNQYNFEFHYTDTTSRRQMRDFMDWIPNGLLVTARIIYNTPTSATIWKSDQNVYGVGNTFYD